MQQFKAAEKNPLDNFEEAHFCLKHIKIHAMD